MAPFLKKESCLKIVFVVVRQDHVLLYIRIQKFTDAEFIKLQQIN